MELSNTATQSRTSADNHDAEFHLAQETSRRIRGSRVSLPASGASFLSQFYQWFVVVLAILSSLCLYALDNTVTANLIPSMVNDLGKAEQLSWLSVGFTLGGTCMILPLGKLYVLLSSKHMFIASAVIFMAGSAVCGAAPTMTIEIIGRVIAGIGGNGLYMGVVTLIGEITEDKERPIYLGLCGVTWGLGTILGPFVGGGLEKFSWRWAFYLNLFIGAVFAPIWIFLIPNRAEYTVSGLCHQLRDFDIGGTILSVGGLLALVLASNSGGVLYSWNSPQIIACFAVSAVCLSLFLVQQHYTIATSIKQRLLPVHLFNHKDAVLLFVLAAASDGPSYIPIFYIPLYFQLTRGDDPLASALRLMPYLISLSCAILFNGAFMSLSGHYKIWFVGGSSLTIAGAVLLSLIDVDTSEAYIYGSQILMGAGTGSFNQAGFPVLMAQLGESEVASATMWITLGQLTGVSSSLAIASAVFLNLASQQLLSLLPNTSQSNIESSLLGLSGTFYQSLDPGVQHEVVHILVTALKKVFIICYTSGSLCFILSLALTAKFSSFQPRGSDYSKSWRLWALHIYLRRTSRLGRV